MSEPAESYRIEPFTSEHITAALELWTKTEHLSIRRGDTPEGVLAFLNHSPGCSFVAISNDQLIGAVLCGHDTRRGYIYHLTVIPSYQRRRIGTELLSAAMDGLAGCGIHKGWALVYGKNPYEDLFWARLGWERRKDLVVYSEITGG